MRGFVSGALIGLAVSALGAGVLSIITAPPEGQGAQPEAAAFDLPPGTGFNGARDDSVAALPEVRPGTDLAGVPKVVAPKADDIAPLEEADLSPGVQPRVDMEAGTGLGEAPAIEETAAPATPRIESDPVVMASAEPVEAPAAPQREAALTVSTEPAQPAPPPVEAAEEPAEAPVEEAPEEVAAAPVVQSDAPAEPVAPASNESSGTQETSGLEAAPEAIEKTEISEPPREEVVISVSPESAPKPETGEAEEPAPEVAEVAPSEAPEPERSDAPSAPAEEAPVAEAEAAPPPVERLPQAGAGEGGQRIRIGKPAGSLVGARETGPGNGAVARVRVGSLPRIGVEVTEEESAEVAELPGEEASGPPIERFAQPFEDPENKPRMAIVLIDDGRGPMGVEALTSFPYPLSFAVDADRPDAEDLMAKYRAAGFEVLAMVRLPEGAQPVDVEQALPVMMGRVPEAVGVMETPEMSLQADRKVSDQVARILADSGHGLLLFSKGLNTAQKLAAKNGVPSATVFRDVDGKDQNASAIRRFLDYGALKAGDEGGVVMVGRLRPETVTALLLWGLEDRARQVALAPVSALMAGNR